MPISPLNITTAELAEVIAPVLEYNVNEIIEEGSRDDIYKITIDFKNKKQTVPVSMSITSEGNIIDGSIVFPEEILNTVRKNTKKK